MKKCVGIITLALAVIISTSGALSANSWFTESDQGWFFYKSPPPPPKKETLPSPQPAPKDTKPGHVQIKERAEMLLGNAVVLPTEENIKEYLIFQKKMLENSQHFAQMWQRTIAKYPELYKEEQSSEQITASIEKEIKALSAKAGVFFFYRSDCEASYRQADVMRAFRDKYKFPLYAVTLDGGVLPQFSGSTMLDNGISVRLGLTTVPVVYLAFPYEDRFEPVSGHYMPLVDIERRLYHYAKLEKQMGSHIFADYHTGAAFGPAR